MKQYFPQEAILKDLFKITKTLFNVSIRRDEAAVWNPDVRFFRVENKTRTARWSRSSTSTSTHAKASAAARGWTTPARATSARKATCRRRSRISPATSAPVSGKPTCFTHDEVITLFHEFGHGLHHMLTRVDELGVSGINGVEWDAVELPSQFMENFCWEWDVLTDMSAHVETSAPLPRELFDKMLAAKNFQNGLGTLRQIVFSMFDMVLHTSFDPSNTTQNANDLAREINEKFHVIPQAPFSRWPDTFSHIFAGGYAAGYSTATNGPKCCQPMRTPRSRKPRSSPTARC